MHSLLGPENLVDYVARIPQHLPILPLRNAVAYPFSVIPLVIGVQRSVKLVEDVTRGDHLAGLVAMKDASIEYPQPEQMYQVGTVARVFCVAQASDSTLQIVVHGLERFRIERWSATEPYLKARIALIPDRIEPCVDLEALQRCLRDLAQEVIALSPNLPDEAASLLEQVKDPCHLAYLIAANTPLQVSQGQRILEMDDVKDKLHALIGHLSHEKEVLKLGRKIRSEVHREMGKEQREYYLRQQMKAIQKELGETDDARCVAAEYAKKIEKAGLPEEAKKEAQRELGRLSGMSPQSAEYSVIKTYLDWLVDLPWNVLTEDQLDIKHARTVLDEDHYDLQEVKERIIEYLAVRKLVRDRGMESRRGEEAVLSTAMGAILCFVGPPGVGKTSLGQSIARALGRKFTRMSLGGIRDEAEIRGHRRTYIGALPGRIIQAIKRAGTRNPVFMLDEVDKIGADWRGDPSSALLEVLDPAQNHAFRDHYLDVDFDLTDVMFITTANQLETISVTLRDRMETISLDGYTELEKVGIAQGFLVPRQIQANGLREEEIVFTDAALRKIIGEYTRETGVRELERAIGAICRKAAVSIAAKELTRREITPEVVQEYLKKKKYEIETPEATEIPGIATALAITAVGGDILFIEATRIHGKGELTLTGQLGDVMKESAQIAKTYVHSKAVQLGVDPDLFKETNVHLHVPAGAVPKDGPSAGLAMVLAIASLFSDRPVRSDVGVTGEITLRGRVLPVGGIKMKILAAYRAGLTTVILPKRNEPDLDELPEEVRDKLSFVPVERIDEALKVVLMPPRIRLQCA